MIVYLGAASPNSAVRPCYEPVTCGASVRRARAVP